MEYELAAKVSFIPFFVFSAGTLYFQMTFPHFQIFLFLRLIRSGLTRRPQHGMHPGRRREEILWIRSSLGFNIAQNIWEKEDVNRIVFFSQNKKIYVVITHIDHDGVTHTKYGDVTRGRYLILNEESR